ncbi:MAG: hypothetical protein HUU46_08500 [Candidatus Hydrogenedentes bacterium]|nr:hypothetical protein [Candidatus Hydrogenedentota bacterium]
MVRFAWLRRAATVATVALLGAGLVAGAAEEKKGLDPSKVKAAAPAAAASGEMEEIKFELPPPFFGGTPLTYFNEHLEEAVTGPRDPFLAPKGAVNLSKGKTVTSSDPDPTFGKLSMITDGEKGYQQEYLTELAPGTQWVQIDLGQQSEIFAVLCWHFHTAERVYFDVVVRTADDADFTKNVQTLYNNDYDNSSGLGIGKDKEYIENNEGRLFSALKDGKGVSGRYVRLYAKGNTTDETSHYVEVEVWGTPAK